MPDSARYRSKRRHPPQYLSRYKSHVGGERRGKMTINAHVIPPLAAENTPTRGGKHPHSRRKVITLNRPVERLAFFACTKACMCTCMCACAGLVETRFLLYSAKRIPKQQGDHKQRDFRKCSRTIEEGTSAHVHMFSHSELPMCCVQYRNARFRIGLFHRVLLAGRSGMMQQLQHQSQTPFERFLALPLVVQSAKPYSRGYQMCCPVHGDKRASLIFWEDEQDGHVGIHCFAGCQRADICAALGIREADLYNGARAPTPGPTRKLDLFDLVLHKFIHPHVLFNAQIEDNYTWKSPGGKSVRGVIRIPYFLEDGTVYHRSRIRTAISAGDGSYWDGAEAPLIPYGLHKLQEARAAKLLWLVEGESGTSRAKSTPSRCNAVTA